MWVAYDLDFQTQLGIEGTHMSQLVNYFPSVVCHSFLNIFELRISDETSRAGLCLLFSRLLSHSPSSSSLSLQPLNIQRFDNSGAKLKFSLFKNT